MGTLTWTLRRILQLRLRWKDGMVQDGGVQGPPELEEGIIQLERRKRLLPFGNDPNDGGGPLKRGSP